MKSARRNDGVLHVSIQLIAPASGAWRGSYFVPFMSQVSIQLIAPASGAKATNIMWGGSYVVGFHSTDCPSEWGQAEVFCEHNKGCFHSTDCPSEWGLSNKAVKLIMIEKFPFN